MSITILDSATAAAVAAATTQQAQVEALIAPWAGGQVRARVLGTGGVLRQTQTLEPFFIRPTNPRRIRCGARTAFSTASTGDITALEFRLLDETPIFSIDAGVGAGPASVDFFGQIKTLCPVDLSSLLFTAQTVLPGPTLPLDRALDLLAAAPENSWVKLNTNRFDDAWSPADLRKSYPYGAGDATDPADRILGAWAAAAYDSTGHRFVCFGGGHANSECADVYQWSVESGQWSLAFNGARIVLTDPFPRYRAVDGNSSPVSAHCYGNINWLPTINRMYMAGGACWGDGAPHRVWSGDTLLRDAGGYTLDMAQAGTGKVAGATGSNVKFGAFASTDLDGANAWTLRDWVAINGELATTGPTGVEVSRIEQGCAVGIPEGGRDCLYFEANNRLWKALVGADPAGDTITRITGLQSGANTNGAMAYSRHHNVILKPNGGDRAARRFFLIDLKDVSTSSAYKQITSLTNEGVTGFLTNTGLDKSCGIVYHEELRKFVVWMVGRQPYLINVPEGNPTPTTGWSVEAPTMDTGTPAPPTALSGGSPNDRGVIGKFKYAPELRCPLAIEDINQGNVWALKLAGWVDPRL